MDTTTDTPRRKSRRTANACIACRHSKIKCSGENPCRNCERRSVRCRFNGGVNKVVVSEKYLRDLQRKAQESRRSASTASNSEVPTEFADGDSEALKRTPVVRPSPNIQTHRSSASLGQQYSSPGTECNQRLDITSLVSPASTTGISQNLETTSSDPSTTQPQHHVDILPGVWSSTFTIPAKTIKNMRKNKRSWIWLAPWSTFSFTIRLMLMLGEKLHPEDPSIPAGLMDTEPYALQWPTAAPTDSPNINGLPTLQHAIYLYNTVKFHLGQPYRFFKEAEFEDEIREFYSRPPHTTIQNRLWFVKFLMTMAFGTAFHALPTDNADPPGYKFFLRAIALIPHPSFLWKDSLLAIEVLALVGLYLFSLDERESAHTYLSQAIHIAQMEGLHTHLPEDELGPEIVTYCRDLWWTLYIMERHFSASIGLPMSVQDHDITTPVNPPSLGSEGDSARSLQVNLSHLLSVILTTVYKPDITPLGAFLEQTRSILHTLAHHAQEIERIICLKFQNSVGGITYGTRHITLQYHQCVIFATRPLLLSVLKERLNILGDPAHEDWHSFLAQTAPVISTGINSAAKTLHILTSEYSLLEAFLPYDIEFAYGAALNLTMADALFPDVVDYQACRHMAHQILDNLISRGNRVAHSRKSELCHLEKLCQELVAQIQQQGHQTLHLFVPEETSTTLDQRMNEDHDSLFGGDHETSSLVMCVNPGQPLQELGAHMPDDMEFLESIGISSEEFISIVQQIGDSNNLPENMLTLS